MHRALLLPEVLLGIIGHYFPPGVTPYERQSRKADLAALARTCRTFKESALDALWAELSDLSPLARCLFDVCCLSGRRYAFNRPLNKTEWNTLRSYTRRVKYIREFSTDTGPLGPSVIREIFPEAPFPDPLFPNLRKMFWLDSGRTVAHAAVSSLTHLHLDLSRLPMSPLLVTEVLSTFRERCPDLNTLRVDTFVSGLLDVPIARQVCWWANLQCLYCNVGFGMDDVLRLPFASTLRWLSFKLDHELDDHVTDLSSAVLFPRLAHLEIKTRYLVSIAALFFRIHLPVIEDLDIFFSKNALKWEVQACKAAIQSACPCHTLTRLMLRNKSEFDGRLQPHLTLDDIPYDVFGDLRALWIELTLPVKFTDADLIDLLSRWPRLEYFLINYNCGWRVDGRGGGGITLSGLVQLLRCCPSLQRMSLAIDTETFTRIPDGLDVSFPPRETLHLKFLDSYIEEAFVPGLVSVFTALGFRSVIASVDGDGDISEIEAAGVLWETVSDAVNSRIPDDQRVILGNVFPTTFPMDW